MSFPNPLSLQAIAGVKDRFSYEVFKQISNAINSIIGAFTTTQTYTPEISATSGTYTSVAASGRYLKFGKLVFINVTISITTAGTAMNTLVSLPIPANPDTHQTIVGVDGTVTGKALTGEIGWNGNFNRFVIRLPDGTNPSADGVVMYLTGVYEAASGA